MRRPDPVDFLAGAVRVALGSEEALRWPQGLDAGDVAAAADQHGVLVLLDRALRSIDAPAALQAAVRPLVRERTERALLLVRQLRALLALLEAERIDVLSVKGPLLALEAYGDVAMRGASGDLDLVVRPADLARTVAAMQRAGYRRVEPMPEAQGRAYWAREAHLFPPSASDGTLVELHAELSGGSATLPLDLDGAMQRSTARPLAGGRFRTLATEDLLLYLTMHAAQHVWRRLIWTADIAALLRRAPAIDWTALCERAAAAEVRHRLAVTLRLAVDLFHTEVPADVQARLFAPRRVAAATRLARHRMRETAAGVAVPQRGMSGLLLQVRCELAVRETAARRGAWLLSTLAPSGADSAALPLPRGLGWLRWVLRPCRLLLRHTRGAWGGARPP
jgi:hypothetical protein